MSGTRETTARGREAQRIETRQRVFEAAVGEFRRSGTASADVGVIAAAAGVSRGTFYFHFPTKEHVLVELEQREERRIVRALDRFTRRPHDLPSALAEIARLVVGSERVLGQTLFKDVLGLHFRWPRPASDEWADHPLIVAVVEELERARERGELAAATDPLHGAMCYMLGLYALLTTVTVSKRERGALLEKYVTTTHQGLQPR